MKKVIYFLTILITMFVFNYINVDAGVCDGLKGHQYCNVSSSSSLLSGISFDKIDEKLTDNSGKTIYFLPKGFNANTTSKDGTVSDDVAFCIDPGLVSPASSFTYNRELDLSSDFDSKVYSMYQKLVKDYKGEYYRAVFEAVLRVWTIRYSYSHVANDVNYKYDLARFLKCADEIDDYVLCNNSESSCNSDYTKYYKEKAQIASNNGFSLNTNCFGQYKGLVSEFYNTSSPIWTDPFEKDNVIKQNFKKTVNGSDYEITFTINFGNFFTNSSAVNGLKLKAASFNSTILFNGVDCSESTCNANSITNNYNNGTKISDLKSLSSGELVYTIKLSPKQYKILYDNGGKITLKYNYNHPMNSDNIYLSRYNNDSENPVYQRMLVIYNHNEERVSEYKLEEVNNMCAHNSVGIYIDKIGNKVNFNTYLNTCGCNKVNVDYLSGSDLTAYNKKCVGEVKVTGNLSKCSVDSPSVENYSIKYVYDKIFLMDDNLNDNKYCSMECSETVNFNNVTGKYKEIRAGNYLKVDYPTTLATKYCKVNVDYNSWESDYYKTLKEVIDAYNSYAYSKAKAAVYSKANSSSTKYYKCKKKYSCPTEEDPKKECEDSKITTSSSLDGYSCSHSHTKYCYYYNSTSYNKIEFNETTKLLSYSKQEISGGCSSSKVVVSSNNLDTKEGELKNLLSSLNSCNEELYVDNNNYYNYEEDLDFYYEQTLKDGKSVKNDDNQLMSKKISIENNVNYDKTTLSKQISLPYISSSGGSTVKIIISNFLSNGGYVLERSLSYENTYSIEDRYTQSFVGGFGVKFVSINTSLKKLNGSNLINIGKVYNIDANALQKSDNKYYFVFNKLGDNNQIYDYYSSGEEIRDSDGVTRKASVEDLKRYCTYETVNDLLCISGTGDSDCDDSSSEGLGAKILFKIVDPNNIDPNNRINQNNKGFENWKNKQSVIADIEDGDTFNLENLEYSFDLDAATIKSIRAYNENNNYLNYDGYSCDEDGNYCKSSFIDNAVNAGYLNGDKLKKSFATIVNGREQWKNFDIITKTITVEDVS